MHAVALPLLPLVLQELWELRQLEGLWVHGNLLRDLPEQLGHLSLLKMLSLAGTHGEQAQELLIASCCQDACHCQWHNNTGRCLSALLGCNRKKVASMLIAAHQCAQHSSCGQAVHFMVTLHKQH